MSSDTRNRKIADTIQRELSELIRLEIRDPRVSMVTLTDVELSRDNSHAKVYFTKLGNDAQVLSCKHGLDSASGYLRAQLASRLPIRTVPVLHFELDTSIERGLHLSKLIDTAVAEDAKHTDHNGA
ncbi:MAG: 30S ribosome-binding factor RbfA [Betaproteobacteria bacterium]|nr:30S ribosome-binding factor RbfA [Betaproteobacteria bacterium]